MIACLGLLRRHAVRVLHWLRHGTPALCVGSLTTLATSPSSTHGLILTVKEGAIGIAGLGGCITQVGAGSLHAGLEVDESRGAIVPIDRGVGARMPARMTVTHSGLLGY